MHYLFMLQTIKFNIKNRKMQETKYIGLTPEKLKYLHIFTHNAKNVRSLTQTIYQSLRKLSLK
jgi:hypothetical protein